MSDTQNLEFASKDCFWQKTLHFIKLLKIFFTYVRGITYTDIMH